MMQIQNDIKGIDAILRVSKAAMLMEPMAGDFNDLLMVAPVRRVMIVAEALSKAAGINETLSAMAVSCGVIGHLRDEGRRRGNGDIVVHGAFLSDFDRVLARETDHA